MGNAGGFPIFWLPGKSRLASSYRVIYGDSDVVVPKRHGEWLAENFDVFDFELGGEEVAAIDALDTGVRGGPEPDSITLETYGREIPEA